MVVALLALRWRAISMTVSGNIDFTADDRFNSLPKSRFIKAHSAKKVAMVGDGNCRHFQFNHPIHDGPHFTSAVKQAVIGMQV